MDGTSTPENAQDALRAGKLPPRRPDRVWGGRGTGRVCSICNTSITPDAVEFELEFIWAAEVTTHHVHVDCFAVWDRERETLDSGDDVLQASA